MKTTHKAVAPLAATFITFGSLVGGANAAVTFSQSGDEITMSVTDQSYMVVRTQLTTTVFVTFANVFPTGESGVSDTARVGGSLSYSINGGPSTIAPWLNGGWQYRAEPRSGWSTKDAFFAMEVAIGTFTDGDTVTFNGYLTVDTTLDPNAIMPSDLTPRLVLTTFWDRLGFMSELTSTPFNVAPEPSSALLLGLGGFGFAVRRRRN
ncbi:PEP-CTERM sorting domain-containing protein [Akkermansiaceae bacterium]|nr:PEP-CTERM sorting domain-containing protein [Akkermansiaceae bacterium]